MKSILVVCLVVAAQAAGAEAVKEKTIDFFVYDESLGANDCLYDGLPTLVFVENEEDVHRVINKMFCPPEPPEQEKETFIQKAERLATHRLAVERIRASAKNDVGSVGFNVEIQSAFLLFAGRREFDGCEVTIDKISYRPASIGSSAQLTIGATISDYHQEDPLFKKGQYSPYAAISISKKDLPDGIKGVRVLLDLTETHLVDLKP